MPVIKFNDVAKIYPFTRVTGLFDRKEKKKMLEQQKAMPYTSNEGVIALQHFSAVINDGEFVVLLGPSGSGKTTVLRLIAGLERPSVGDISFDDVNYNDVIPQERDVAMVFQNYSLYPNQTVYDNLAFPLQVKHTVREQLDKEVRYMAELLNLNDKLSSLPHELSGGEKQRVAIARALVKRPAVFLLDEPFSNLDVVMRARLRSELKKLHQVLRTTFIYVTHDQSEALALADRIIVLKDGICQQAGSAAEVYNYPANRFVGEFVGFPAMNIFEDVPVDRKDGSYELLGKKRQLTRDQLRKLGRNNTADIGVRPVNLAIGNKGMEVEVSYTEPIGADLIIHCQKNDREIIVVEKIREGNEMPYLRGQKLLVSTDQQYLHIFDKEGNRL